MSASHIAPAQSRLMARQRLATVIAEQRDDEAKQQVELERTRTEQLSRILALKLSIASEKNRQHELHEIAERREKAKEKQLQTLRAELRAKGLNDEAVILQQRELERQDRERRDRQQREEVNQAALMQRLEREETLRRKVLQRESQRLQQKEVLRKKVSRSLIEQAAEKLKRQHTRKMKLQAEEESKQELNIVSSQGLSVDVDDNDKIEAEVANDSDDDDSEAKNGDDSADASSSVADISPHRSLTLIAPITHLQHYQQKAHQAKLATKLAEARFHHQHRERQPIMGKLYHSAPFVATPPIVRFDDIVVGQPLKQSLTLTNTSFTFTNIQVRPVTGALSDCLIVSYQPPGRLSSGQTFTLSLSLTPKTNTELSGTVDFISECGPFSVPVAINTRKAIINVNVSALTFKAVLGDSERKTVVVRNEGATDVDYRASLADVSHTMHHDCNDGHKQLGAHPLDEDFHDYQPIALSSITGKLAGYSSVELPLTFHPKYPAASAMTLLIDCANTNTESDKASGSGRESVIWGSPSSLSVALSAECNDVPVYLPDGLLAFGACISGKLYRSCLTLHNRSHTAHRFTMHCPAILKDFVSFLPVVGYIQPDSIHQVQVKLKIPKGMEEVYFDRVKASGAECDSEAMKKNVMRVSMTIDVSEQTLSVPWTLTARLTSSRLSFSHSTITFGSVFVGQCAVVPVTITNHSIVMQKLTFSSLPSHCSVLTDDGFITILPLRSYTVNIAFTPVTSTKHSWTISVKSKLGDDYQLRCMGSGVKCPINFNRATITMRALCNGDKETVSIELTNVSVNKKAVQLMVPSDTNNFNGNQSLPSFLTVEPPVVVMEAGETRKVHVSFRPMIADANDPNNSPLISAISEEEPAPALTLGKPALSAKPEPTKKPAKGKKIDAAEQARLDEEARAREERRLVEEAENARIKAEAEAKRQADRVYHSKEARQQREREHPSNPLLPESLMSVNDEDDSREPYSRLGRHRIACHIVDYDTLVSRSTDANTDARSSETSTDSETVSKPPVQSSVFYLQVSTAVVSSPLQFVDLPSAQLDCGSIAVGMTTTKKFTIVNESDETQSLSVTGFTRKLPFALVSSLTELQPQQAQSVTLSFSPTIEREWKGELVHVVCQSATRTIKVPLTLIGRGIVPSVTLTPSQSRLCFATTRLGHAVKQTVRLTNTSDFPMHLRLSLTMMEHSTRSLIGVLPFTATPTQWVVESQQSCDLVVRFTPDRYSRTYYGRLMVNDRAVLLHGVCSQCPVFLVIEQEMLAKRVEYSDGSMALTGHRALDAIAEVLVLDDRPSEFDSAFKPAEPEAAPSNKAVKPAKGKGDAKSTISEASAAMSVASVRMLAPHQKLSLYDQCLSTELATVLTLSPSQPSLSFALRCATLDDSDKQGAGGYEIMIGKFDATDAFLSVKPGAGSLKQDEAADITVGFDYEQFEQWRAQSELWRKQGSGRRYVEGVLRANMRYQSGEKGAQPIVVTQMVGLRVTIV